jgi:hypothetical protein
MWQAQVIYVPEDVYFYPDEQLGNEQEEIIKMRESTTLINYIQEKKVKRGDIVVLGLQDGYRNDYRFIYDGQTLCHLCYDPPCGYDYGIIPREFLCLNEFPVDYWKSAIRGWNLVWIPFDSTMKQQILDSAKIYSKSNKVYKAKIHIDQHKVTVYISSEEELPLEDMLSNYYQEHLEGDKLCVWSVGNFSELPTGANIMHIWN